MGPWQGADWLGFEALPLPLFEPHIFHLQMGLFHPPGPGLQVWARIGWCFANLTSLEGDSRTPLLTLPTAAHHPRRKA